MLLVKNQIYLYNYFKKGGVIGMYDFLMILGVLFFLMFLFLLPFLDKLICRLKILPTNTAIIIDRNFHYHKTIRKGFYFLNPSKDRITTYISNSPYTKMYVQNSESHNGVIFSLGYNVTYKVNNVEEVLERLKSNRRSVDDIIQSCVKTSIANFDAKYIMGIQNEFVSEINRRLAISFAAFEIELINVDFFKTSVAPEGSEVFEPHISRGDDPIKYK